MYSEWGLEQSRILIHVNDMLVPLRSTWQVGSVEEMTQHGTSDEQDQAQFHGAQDLGKDMNTVLSNPECLQEKVISLSVFF